MTAGEHYRNLVAIQAAHLEGMRTVYSDMIARFRLREVHARATGKSLDGDSAAHFFGELARELELRAQVCDPELAAELLRKRGVVPPHEVVR